MPLRWQCPASLASRSYTAKSDVYSFGVLLFEIFSEGAVPFGSMVAEAALKAVLAGERLPRPQATTPDEAVELIRRCMRLAVAERPTVGLAEQVLLRLLVASSGRQGDGLTAAALLDKSQSGGRAEVGVPAPVQAWVSRSGGHCSAENSAADSLGEKGKSQDGRVSDYLMVNSYVTEGGEEDEDEDEDDETSEL